MVTPLFSFFVMVMLMVMPFAQSSMDAATLLYDMSQAVFWEPALMRSFPRFLPSVSHPLAPEWGFEPGGSPYEWSTY
jgi:hypothetical protein